MIFPHSMKKGETVALIAPSSPLGSDIPIDAIVQAVEQLGYHTWVGDSCRKETTCGYASAEAEVRVRDIHRAFADPEIRGIWCVRGGSTAWRLLPLLDYGLIAANPKPFIGFSDVTTLHLALQQRCGMVTFHGPNASRLPDKRWDAFSLGSLERALSMGACLPVENPPEQPVISLRPGRASGRLTGGNLSLVAAGVGTPWQIDARGCILYLEDVDEPVYALERMLCQLRYAGILDAAAGLVFGTFKDCGNDYNEAYGPEQLLRELLAGYPKPALLNIWSAHCLPMVTLPMGVQCEIDGNTGAMMLNR